MIKPATTLITAVALAVSAATFTFAFANQAQALDTPLKILDQRRASVTVNTPRGDVTFNAARSYTNSELIPLNVTTQPDIRKILWTLYTVDPNNPNIVTRFPGIGGSRPSTDGQARMLLTLGSRVSAGDYQIQVCTLGRAYCEMSVPIKIVN